MKKLFITSHLMVGISALLLLLSGLRIASQEYDFWLRLDWLLPSGLVHIWHMAAGICLLVSLPIMLFCLYGRRKEKKGFKLSNLLGSVLLCLSVLTGTLQFVFEVTHYAVRISHYYFAIIFLFFIIVHPLRYYFSRPIPHLVEYIVKPLTSIRSFLYIGGLGLTMSALYLWILTSPTQLTVSRISDNTFVRIDGLQNETVWQDAQEFTVSTFAGANFINGTTEVAVKAIHNSTEAYFFLRWQDPTKSELHLPIIKTADGWKVQTNGFEKFDEREFYEDKFAMLFSNSCNIAAAGTAHLGKKPNQSLPSNTHGKGFHYSEDGVADLWQWKAVRTNAMYLMDDNHIGKPSAPLVGAKRYTGGYRQDADYGGSYVMNWQWFDTDTVTPKRIPRELSNSHVGFANWFDYRAYDDQSDTFPIGSVIKSVLYRSNQIEGGRADVRAFGTYSDGYWQLEVVRKKQVNEPTDLALSEGLCMWVSAFDRAQIAHTRHVKPFKLHFED